MLPNPKHERFAQEYARGKSASEAYEIAGFKPNRHNAAALARQEHIVTRVQEIQAEQAAIALQATEKAAERLSIDREWVMAQLISNASEARDVGQLSASNQALQLLGKELGMFVDRSLNENVNTTYVVSGEPIDSPEEWAVEFGPKH